MADHHLGNGQSATVGATGWNTSTLTFDGTTDTPAALPIVTFSGPNTLAAVAVVGTAATHAYGAISLAAGGALVTDAILLSHGTLSLTERPFQTITLDGLTTISNGSTLTAAGYAGLGSDVINGTATIDGSSVVNMDYVAVSGSGTFELSAAGALLRLGKVAAGETVKLNGGMLSLTDGMTFLGTITDATPATSRIGTGTSVAVYTGLGAVRETFDRKAGILDLFDAQGTDVVHLRFAGQGDLYAAPTEGLATNYLDISSRHTDASLPVSFIP